MSALIIGLPEDLIEDMPTILIADFDAETRFDITGSNVCVNAPYAIRIAGFRTAL